MTTATALDHAGVGARDLPGLAAAYERLGFTLTPMARHRGKATANRCAMLRDGYLELIAPVEAPVDGAAPDRLAAQLGRYEGVHIVALGMADSAGNLARLQRAGVPIEAVVPLSRPVDEAAPDGPQARFERLPLPDAPEGTIQLVRHLTPELIWQPHFTAHRNGAVALDQVVMAVPDPAATAARVSRLAGLPVVPDPAGGFALPTGRGQVRMLPPAALGAVFPGVEPPTLPWVAGMVVDTADRCAALRPLLDGVQWREAGTGVLVLPEDAGGAALLFT